ncbi:Lrp/AsnC family transcriptional regulator [Paracoccus aminophilus]|uniref:Transcriptional regulator, AsnC family n=1 Tax=Paracoccus aminophilus JCM 7686 TaxID=1367847 RepID=S5YHP7_PARAH|nr:Lrp/AsnC family transcriptional regulator [Paracoccus aminophilus]AGT10988.1 transcriptional regulator, AsnC family [Paracoccus aminophilus JCM 7686]
MDSIDRKILAELQREGRISVTELGERVGLSLSPCHRRVRALEEARVINGYRATVDPSKVGLNFSAIVFVTLQQVSGAQVIDFEAALPRIPEIVQAERLFGDPDYMLQIVTRDLATFQKLYDEHLLALPSVQRLTSTLVMKTVIARRPLPL